MCAPEERPDATPSGHRVGVEDAESEQGRLRAQGVETADTRHAATVPLSYLCSTHNSAGELGELPTTRSDDGPSTARRGAALLGPERAASNEQGIVDF